MIKEKDNDNRFVLSSLIWQFSEKWGCQIINAIITIILARLLDPSTYGVIAIVNAFIAIFNVFIDNGLGNSLIQKKDTDDIDFSSAFFANVLICSFVYLVLFLTAPYIAEYYNIIELASLIRVSGITILISAVKNIQQAYISKNMMFRKFFFASLIGTIGAGFIGVYLAKNGFGVWAIIYSNLFDTIIDTICIWISIKWRPKLVFSFKRLKELYKYGWKLFASAILDRIYNKFYHIFIGKYYSSADLAFYDKGNSLTSKISDNIDSAVNAVLFPSMSLKQDNKEDVKKIAKRALKTNFYVMTPIFVGLFVVCEPLVQIILTKKWLPAVPYIRVFCLINILLPIHTINLSVLKASGRSDVVLKQEIVKKIVGLSILFFTIKKGPLTILLGKLLSSILSVIINCLPNKRNINYSLREQFLDIIPSVVLSFVMGAIVNLISFANYTPVITLLMQIVTGVILYILLSFVLKNDSFFYIISILKGYLINGKHRS